MWVLRKIAFFSRRERQCVFLCVECCFTTVMAAPATGSWPEEKQTTARPVSPLFEEVHHFFEVVDAVLPFHVHQDAVWGRLHGHVEEGVDSRVIQYLGHLLWRAEQRTVRRTDKKAAQLCGTLSLGWGKSSYKNNPPPKKKDKKKMSKMFNKFVWSQLKYWKVQCAAFLWNFHEKKQKPQAPKNVNCQIIHWWWTTAWTWRPTGQKRSKIGAVSQLWIKEDSIKIPVFSSIQYAAVLHN